jgi:hypothetical protein
MYTGSMTNFIPKHLPHRRRLRVMHGSKYLTLPSEWDLDAYEEYLVQRDPTGRITLDPTSSGEPTRQPTSLEREASP